MTSRTELVVFFVVVVGVVGFVPVYAQSAWLVQLKYPDGEVAAGQSFTVEVSLSFRNLVPPQAIFGGIVDDSNNVLPATVNCFPMSCESSESLGVIIPSVTVSGSENVNITLTAPSNVTTWNLKAVAGVASVGSSGQGETSIQSVRPFQIQIAVATQIQTHTESTIQSTSSATPETSTSKLYAPVTESAFRLPADFYLYLAIAGTLTVSVVLLLHIRKQVATKTE